MWYMVVGCTIVDRVKQAHNEHGCAEFERSEHSNVKMF